MRFGPEAFGEADGLHDFEAKLAGFATVEEAVAACSPPAKLDDSAAVVLQSDVPPSVQQAMQDFADAVGTVGPPPAPKNSGPPFSQAWTISGARAVDGKAILVTDPRYPIDRPTNLMEIHVRGATFEVRGIVPPGCMNVLVGSSRGVAWGGSALAYDQSDLFRLDFDPAQPDGHSVDGTFRAWIPPSAGEPPVDEMILIAGEPSEPFTYRESSFGPVVTVVVNDAAQGEEYALRMTPLFAPERNAARGFFAMYRATDIDEFSTALADWTFPSVNIVFADTGGRIGYWANGAVPARSPQQDYFGLGGDVAQLGEETGDDWLGFVPHELLPHVMDPASGVLFTANHMPVGSWYPITLGMPTGSTGDTNRSRRLRELFEGGRTHVRRAGTHGLPRR